MKRVTRKDVADKAGVSETIVSYVLNGNRYVDKTKKNKVLKATKELGYHPSPMARALKGKGSNHYLFIADDLRSEHFAIIINEMEELVKDKGICISLCSDRSDTALLSWHFDGLIIASLSMSEERINQYISTGVPVIVLGMKKYENLEGVYGLINSGLEDGAYRAVKKLIEKGRKRILYVPSILKDSSFFDRNDYRYIGYKKAIAEYGLEELIMKQASSPEMLKENIKTEYSTLLFDAIFARTDTTAAISMQALAESEIKIPEKVSIIGVNNSSLSKYITPSLSTINIKRDEIASWIIKLITKLNKKDYENIDDLKVLLNTELIERNTI